MAKIYTLKGKERIKKIIPDIIFHDDQAFDHHDLKKIYNGYDYFRLIGAGINSDNQALQKSNKVILEMLTKDIESFSPKVKVTNTHTDEKEILRISSHEALKQDLESYWGNKNRINFVAHKRLSEYFLESSSKQINFQNILLNKRKDFNIYIEYYPLKDKNERTLLGTFFKYVNKDTHDILSVTDIYEDKDKLINFSSVPIIILKEALISMVLNKSFTRQDLNYYNAFYSEQMQYNKLSKWEKIKSKLNNSRKKIKYEDYFQENHINTKESQGLNALNYVLTQQDKERYQNVVIGGAKNKKKESHLSKEKVIFVGEEFIELKYYNSPTSIVRSHIRNQPYKNGFIKPILIESYEKRNVQPLYDRDALKDPSEDYIQWEKKACIQFEKDIKKWIVQNKLKMFKEFKVLDNSNHRIDYIFQKDNIVIGVEYKSDNASWSREKIQAQRIFYDKALKKRFDRVYTFLVSDKGKYGINHLEFIKEANKVISNINDKYKIKKL